jgi:ubiquinone/menaquinone biosynthesis C-methylase UbiE
MKFVFSFLLKLLTSFEIIKPKSNFMANTREGRYIHGTHRSEQARLAELNYLTNASFIEFVEVKETDHVLELGSGLGILAEKISQKLVSGRMTGIEISSEQIAKCPPENEKLVFTRGDAQDLPYKENTFDVVYCRYILEHVQDPLRMLKEARRVLKPGGKLFIQENSILILKLYPECIVFDQVWNAFARYQSHIGGDAMIGLKLYDLLKRADFKEPVLSMAPEIHYRESGTHIPWIDNLIGNIHSAKDQLVSGNYITEEQYNRALGELEEFKGNENASSYFYWNRARGTK